MLLLLPASLALAASISGDFLTIDYDDGGTWNNTTDGVGYRAEVGGAQVEFTYAGTPYQAWGVGYEGPDGWQTYVANSAFGDSILVLSGEDTSTPGTRAYTWNYLTPELEVTKTEWFDERDVSTAVQFTLTNKGTTELDGVEVLYALDPDPDAAAYGDYSTVETVGDADRDGTDDWAAASGPSSGVTIGLGACDASAAVLGFFSSWQTETPVDVVLTDPAGASGDDAMALQYYAAHPLAPGESLSFRLLVAVDASAADAAQTYLGLAPDVCCDQDGDAEPGLACGGADCDDTTAAVGPAVAEVPYDGVDQDCSGADATDLDGDGQASAAVGGPDCDDTDPAVSTLQAEVWYDGVDQNCDGNDDDQDLDGAPLAFDCDDEDPAIQVDCPEPDTGDGGPVTTSGGCGCSTGAGPAGAAAALLALGLVLLRRR